MSYDTDYVIESCVQELFNVQSEVREMIWRDSARCFESVYLNREKKAAAVVDIVAEWRVVEGLRHRLRKLNPRVMGEESLRSGFRDLEKHEGPVIMLDVIDGTRLLEYGWNDWCSAATVFDPRSRLIDCAVVALPSGVCYFASGDGAGKCRRKGRGLEYLPITGPGAAIASESATIAFYGYRAQRLAEVCNRLIFPRLCANSSNANPTVFTIGGNPALVRVVDGARTINAVVEPFGQSVHDMLPGAYICRQAGGILIDLAGQILNLESLLDLGPEGKVTYIAASNLQLAMEIQREISDVSEKTPVLGSTELSGNIRSATGVIA